MRNALSIFDPKAICIRFFFFESKLLIQLIGCDTFGSARKMQCLYAAGARCINERDHQLFPQFLTTIVLINYNIFNEPGSFAEFRYHVQSSHANNSVSIFRHNERCVFVSDQCLKF